jgi:hypothetical protein
MNIIFNGKPVTLTSDDFLQGGGEGDVYLKGDTCFKIYHEPRKMPAKQKLKELAALAHNSILAPCGPIYDKHLSHAIGFSMPYAGDSHLLCQLSNRQYRQQHGITSDTIGELVAGMRDTLLFIHSKGCLVVDYNDMNMLVSKGDPTIIRHIDVDSFQTPTSKATALMDSVRDRTITGHNWTKGSDWFAFAVTVFKLYTGAHPFKGRHPNYKPAQWMQRMDDGVSIFAKGAKSPPNAAPLDSIPARLRVWLCDVLQNGVRSPMPAMTGEASSIPFTEVLSNAKVKLEELFSTGSLIRDLFTLDGHPCAVTDRGIYQRDDLVSPGLSQGVMCLDGDWLAVKRTRKGVLVGDEEIECTGATCVGGRLFCMSNSSLNEVVLRKTAAGIRYAQRLIMGINLPALATFQGCWVQTLINTKWLIVPSGTGAKTLNIKEWAKGRVMDACAIDGAVLATVQYRDVIKAYKVDITGGRHVVTDLGEVDDISVGMIKLPQGIKVYTYGDRLVLAKGGKQKVVDLDGVTLGRLVLYGGEVWTYIRDKVYRVRVS